MGWFGLEVTFEDHLVQLVLGYLVLDEVAQSPIQSSCPNDGAPTTYVGNQ